MKFKGGISYPPLKPPISQLLKQTCHFDEMASKIDTVISEVTAILPKGFPNVIADSIFQGMK